MPNRPPPRLPGCASGTPGRARRARTWHLHQAKPLTLAHGLADSPAGLAAWIVENWHGWSLDSDDVFSHFRGEELLGHLTLSWLTNSIATSLVHYWAHDLPPGPRPAPRAVEIPTAFYLTPVRTPAYLRARSPSASTRWHAGASFLAAATSSPPRSPICSPMTYARRSGTSDAGPGLGPLRPRAPRSAPLESRSRDVLRRSVAGRLRAGARAEALGQAAARARESTNGACPPPRRPSRDERTPPAIGAASASVQSLNAVLRQPRPANPFRSWSTAAANAASSSAIASMRPIASRVM